LNSSHDLEPAFASLISRPFRFRIQNSRYEAEICFVTVNAIDHFPSGRRKGHRLSGELVS
jgi:hypothetical protein